MNMDTGNTFIAGQDPVRSSGSFGIASATSILRMSARAWPPASRGGLTGIAVSHCAIGDGVNADNIREWIEILLAGGYAGVFSIECEGQGGPMIERSLAWVRALVAESATSARVPASSYAGLLPSCGATSGN